MLKFRRATPAAPRTEPAPPRKAAVAAPAVTTNAGKARALLAMLEQGGDAAAAGVAPERLRDWARDLVETVEKRRIASGSTAAPAAPEPKARLFKTPAPMLKPMSGDEAAPARRPASLEVGAAMADAPPQSVPAQPVSAARLAAAAAFRAPASAPMTAITPDLPVQHIAEAARPPVAAPRATLTRDDVRRLVGATIDPESLAREHPAIIAMTLVGRSTLDQAAALRRLPGGQVRAVHRALRLMEGAGS